MRVDEITVFKTIEADKNTLTIKYDVEREDVEFIPEFKQMIAEDFCTQDILATDFSRGAILNVFYTAPSGRTIAQYVVTQEDC
jgi:hypothetical protein